MSKSLAVHPDLEKDVLSLDPFTFELLMDVIDHAELCLNTVNAGSAPDTVCYPFLKIKLSVRYNSDLDCFIITSIQHPGLDPDLDPDFDPDPPPTPTSVLPIDRFVEVSVRYADDGAVIWTIAPGPTDALAMPLTSDWATLCENPSGSAFRDATLRDQKRLSSKNRRASLSAAFVDGIDISCSDHSVREIEMLFDQAERKHIRASSRASLRRLAPPTPFIDPPPVASA